MFISLALPSLVFANVVCLQFARCSGLDVLGKFSGFIKSSPEEAAEKEAALTECLRGLDAYLAEHGPFVGGASPCATDCAVMPRLYHMQVGAKHFRVGGLGEIIYGVGEGLELAAVCATGSLRSCFLRHCAAATVLGVLYGWHAFPNLYCVIHSAGV
jgi:hypothetical protein